MITFGSQAAVTAACRGAKSVLLRSSPPKSFPRCYCHHLSFRRQSIPLKYNLTRILSPSAWTTKSNKFGNNPQFFLRQLSKTTTEKGVKKAAAAEAPTSSSSFWKRFLGAKEMPPRWTLSWYREMVLICTVFAITGSSTMILVRLTTISTCMLFVDCVTDYLSTAVPSRVRIAHPVIFLVVRRQVRPAVSKGLGLKGSLKDGPWSYRICSIVVMTPIYATLLVVVGTVFGRHHYFRHFSVKMWSRFGIPPEMLDETYHITKKNFRKW